MISRLLEAGYTGKVTKTVTLKNAEITAICLAAREVFLSQPTLIELSPPVKIVGDVHGQYSDLIRMFEMCGFPPSANFLFLGDYVDRGKQSLETILLVSRDVRISPPFPSEDEPQLICLFLSCPCFCPRSILKAPLLQDQVPGELLPPSRKPRGCQRYPSVRILRRMQASVQHQDLEGIQYVHSLLHAFSCIPSSSSATC